LFWGPNSLPLLLAVAATLFLLLAAVTLLNALILKIQLP